MVLGAVVSVLMVVVALALAGVGAAGALGRLPRNRFAGVRTPASLASVEAFRVANRAAAPAVLAGALVVLLGAMAPAAFGGGAGTLVALGCVVVGFVAVAAGGVAGTRAAAAVPAPAQCAPTACASCTGCSLVGAHDAPATS
jgi:hypothetical protein